MLYSATRGEWVPAGELAVGENLLTATGPIEIESIRPKPGTHRVYNFEVETNHTYLASDAKVVSHNSNPCAGGGGGKVYKVDGSKTPSGKPYVGRTKQSSPAKRGKRDGRDRSDAEVVDTYDANDTAAGRRAEQQAMNREGGVDNLDNKRNEIRPDDWQTNGVDPPQ